MSQSKLQRPKIKRTKDGVAAKIAKCRALPEDGKNVSGLPENDGF